MALSVGQAAPAGAGLGSLLGRVSSATVVSLVGMLCAKGTNLLLHVVLGRALGGGGYGVYSLAFGLLLLAAPISTLGLPWGLVKFGVEYRTKRMAAHYRGLLFFTFAGIAATSVGLAAAGVLLAGPIAGGFRMGELRVPLIVMFCGLPFLALTQTLAFFFRSVERFDLEALIRNILRPVLNLAAVVVFLGALTPALAGACHGGSYLIALLLSSLAAHRIFARWAPGGERKYDARAWLRFGAPMFLMGYVYDMMLQIDRMIIAAYGTAEQVGIYSGASILARQLELSTTVLLAGVGTVLAELHAKGDQALGAVIRIATKWALVLAVPGFFALLFLPDLVLGIFGSEFRDAGSSLVLLCFGQMFVAVGSVSGLALRLRGRGFLDLMNMLGGLVLNASLCRLLIPAHGIAGAAAATMTSILCVQGIRAIELRRIDGIHPLDRQTAGIAAVAVLVGLAVSAFSGPDLGVAERLAAVGLGIAVFALACAALGLRAEEKALVRRLLARSR